MQKDILKNIVKVQTLNRLEKLKETIDMSKAEMKRENRKRNKLLQNKENLFET